MLGKKEAEIRRARKEALYFREISQLVLQITLDDPELNGVHISSVRLSPDKSVCNVLFSCEEGPEEFRKRLSNLILYKPSLRKALSQRIPSRYTPNLVFKYDAQMEKQRRLETLFDKLEVEDKL